MGCKKQGAKNRVSAIQKEILDLFLGSQTDPCFQNKNNGCRLTGWRPEKIMEIFPGFEIDLDFSKP